MLTRDTFHWLAVVTFMIPMFGCMTSSERMKVYQMQEHRVRANLILKNADTQGMLQKAALADPDYERVYYARIKDVLDKRNVVHPQVRKNVWPTYPDDMRRNFKEAYLYFAFVIGPNGNISSVRYLPLPNLEADESFVTIAKEALEKWEFQPGSVDGAPHEFVYMAPVAFRLK